MRQILILLAFICAPAFCQDDSVNTQFHYNPQWFPKLNILKPGLVLKLHAVKAENICSIPLLNAKPAGNPVHMPEFRMPQGALDHMAAKPPAPVCPAR